MSHSTNAEVPMKTHIQISSLIETDVHLNQEETSNFIEQINCESNKTLDLPQPVDSTHIATANENISEENDTVGANNQPVTSNCNQQLEQEEGKLASLGYFGTFFFFFLYLADIWSDMSLALSFCLYGNYDIGLVVLWPVYQSSFATSLLTWETKQDKSLKYRFLYGFLVFIFNLTAVVLYLEIIRLLRRKLKKKSYSNTILETKQQTLKTLKATEASLEACFQIYIQTLIISYQDEDITWLQYVSVVTSTLGIIISLVGFLAAITKNYPNISLFGEVIKYLWLSFDAVFFIITLITLSILPFAGILALTFMLTLFGNWLCRAYLYNKLSTEKDLSREIWVLTYSYLCYSYFSFELNCNNSWKAILARIIAIIIMIPITIQCYYCQNKIPIHLTFLFDLINYVSILCFTLGLIVVILVTVQIIRVSRVRCEDNVDKHRLFFCN